MKEQKRFYKELKIINDYMKIKETAELWGVSIRWVKTLYKQGKIEGVIKFGKEWAIPKTAEKPSDGRITTGEYNNWR